MDTKTRAHLTRSLKAAVAALKGRTSPDLPGLVDSLVSASEEYLRISEEVQSAVVELADAMEDDAYLKRYYGPTKLAAESKKLRDLEPDLTPAMNLETVAGRLSSIMSSYEEVEDEDE